MLTIAGGILLALLIIALLPAILTALGIVVPIVLGAILLIAVLFLLFMNPELLMAAAVIFAFFLPIFLLMRIDDIWQKSRNFGLMVRELKTLLYPAFTLSAKARRQVTLDKIKSEIKHHNKAEQQKLLAQYEAEMQASLQKVWSKYEKYGPLKVLLKHENLDNHFVVLTPNGKKALDITIHVNFPTARKRSFWVSSYNSLYDSMTCNSLWRLRLAIKKILKRQVLEMEKGFIAKH